MPILNDLISDFIKLSGKRTGIGLVESLILQNSQIEACYIKTSKHRSNHVECYVVGNAITYDKIMSHLLKLGYGPPYPIQPPQELIDQLVASIPEGNDFTALVEANIKVEFVYFYYMGCQVNCREVPKMCRKNRILHLNS